jgi:hypothetical protein
MKQYAWYSLSKYKQGCKEYIAFNLYDQETLCNLITNTRYFDEKYDYFFCGEITSYKIYEQGCSYNIS